MRQEPGFSAAWRFARRFANFFAVSAQASCGGCGEVPVCLTDGRRCSRRTSRVRRCPPKPCAPGASSSSSAFRAYLACLFPLAHMLRLSGGFLARYGYDEVFLRLVGASLALLSGAFLAVGPHSLGAALGRAGAKRLRNRSSFRRNRRAAASRKTISPRRSPLSYRACPRAWIFARHSRASRKRW